MEKGLGGRAQFSVILQHILPVFLASTVLPGEEVVFRVDVPRYCEEALCIYEESV